MHGCVGEQYVVHAFGLRNDKTKLVLVQRGHKRDRDGFSKVNIS